MLVCDADGRLVEGSGELPVQFKADLAIYRESPQRQACVFAAPRTAMAAAMARYAAEAADAHGVGHRPTAWRPGSREGSPLGRGREARLPAPSRAPPRCTSPGVGVWAAAADIFEACNRLPPGVPGAGEPRRRPDEPGMQTVRARGLGQAVAPVRRPPALLRVLRVAGPGAARASVRTLPRRHKAGAAAPFVELKAAMAFSCRALWARGHPGGVSRARQPPAARGATASS